DQFQSVQITLDETALAAIVGCAIGRRDEFKHGALTGIAAIAHRLVQQDRDGLVVLRTRAFSEFHMLLRLDPESRFFDYLAVHAHPTSLHIIFGFATGAGIVVSKILAQAYGFGHGEPLIDAPWCAKKTGYSTKHC